MLLDTKKKVSYLEKFDNVYMIVEANLPDVDLEGVFIRLHDGSSKEFGQKFVI